jgi:hypothetical protein
LKSPVHHPSVLKHPLANGIVMIDKVVVGKDAIPISGPRSVLAHQLTAEKTAAAVTGAHRYRRMARPRGIEPLLQD